MRFAHITLAVDEGVATLTLNMPARLNALSEGLQREVIQALDSVAQDTSVRALRLTGAGRAFCVGADLSGLGADGAGGRSLGQHTADAMLAVSNPLILALRALPVPVLVAMALARRLAALPAHGVVEARAAYDHSERSNLAEQLHYEASRQRELLDQPTFSEGVQAFLHKREPRFSGR